jgi:hypothetical protein
MRIKISEWSNLWCYILCRRNGKGRLYSESYTRRAECVRMAKRTAKQLGIPYREGRI